jgi:hypothetical protein
MSDEHKSYKSSVIILCGKKFEIQHKSNNILNNKLLIFCAFIKHYINIVVAPVCRCCNIYFPLIIVFGFCLLLIIFIIIITTKPSIEKQIEECFISCPIFKKYCDHLTNSMWSIRKKCIRQHLSFISVAFDNFKIILGVILYIIRFIIPVSIIIIFCQFIFNKIYVKTIEINDKLPIIVEIEEI